MSDRATTWEVLVPGAIIRVPPEIAGCPYCGADLTAMPEAWTQEDDGTWAASESGIECMAEPELDEDKPELLEIWDEWLAQHTYMPYVYWMPVDQKVIAWLKSKYRFQC